MGIGRRIKEARISAGRTQEELAADLGITKSAVANYENETSHPRETILYRLFDVLQVDANYLFQDVMPGAIPPEQLSFAEREHIKKYRKLSDYAKQTIDYLLDRELSAPVSLHAGSSSVNITPSPVSIQASSSGSEQSHAADILQLHTEREYRLYPYLNMVASAGTGSYSADVPTETLNAPLCPHADFIIGVSGNSMEPLYHDGDLLYVARTDHLSEGEIGIFDKDGSLYIKKVGKDRLISLNPEYPDIYPDSGMITSIGRVLDRCDTGR